MIDISKFISKNLASTSLPFLLGIYIFREVIRISLKQNLKGILYFLRFSS